MLYTGHFLPVGLFIRLYKVVLTFVSVYEILKCDHSNESLTEQYFLVVLLIMLYKVVRTFESVDEILKCDYSDTLLAVLSGGVVLCTSQRNFVHLNGRIIVQDFYFPTRN